MELLNHTVPARRDPERVLATLSSAVAEAMVMKGARGEAAETAEVLLGRLSEQARWAS